MSNGTTVNPAVEKSLKSAATSVKWLCIIIAAAILLSGITFVQSDEVALVLRFGKLVGKTPAEQINEPGLKFTLPYLFDEVIRVPVKRIQEVRVDNFYSEGHILNAATSGYGLTGDENFVLVNGTAKYRIMDPVSYALNFEEPEAVLKELVAASILQVLASWEIDNILTMEQKELADQVLVDSQKRTDDIGMGVSLVSIEFSHIQPPHEVRREFDMVTDAYLRQETMLQEANKYREEVIPEATAERDRMIRLAESDKVEMLAKARSDVAVFHGLLDEYEKNPSLTRVRVYRDRTDAIMERVIKKRILPADDSKETVIILPPF